MIKEVSRIIIILKKWVDQIPPLSIKIFVSIMLFQTVNLTAASGPPIMLNHVNIIFFFHFCYVTPLSYELFNWNKGKAKRKAISLKEWVIWNTLWWNYFAVGTTRSHWAFGFHPQLAGDRVAARVGLGALLKTQNVKILKSCTRTLHIKH